MVKKVIQTETPPRLEQVLFMDSETTDLIYEIDQTMPFILQFSVVAQSGESFDRLVMPSDENFEIDSGATRVNGWTKDKFMKERLLETRTIDFFATDPKSNILTFSDRK